MAVRFRYGMWEKQDRDIAGYYQFTCIPVMAFKYVCETSIIFNLPGFKEMTFIHGHRIRDLDPSLGLDANEWTRSSEYQTHPLPLPKVADDGTLCVNIHITILFRFPEKRDLERILPQPSPSFSSSSPQLMWVKTLGLMPDATIELSNKKVMFVHQSALKSQSDVYEAQFDRFKQNKIHVDDSHPLAVFAHIHSMYINNRYPKQSLSCIFKAADHTKADETWNILADTFTLAERHFQWPLMRCTVEHLTAHIPTTCFKRAIILSRLSLSSSSSSTTTATSNNTEHDRIYKHFNNACSNTFRLI